MDQLVIYNGGGPIFKNGYIEVSSRPGSGSI
jgi:hypothetical protein